ncbi:MAG: hypothetical protein U1A77_02460 [Pirellulales bacterium]
MRTGDVNRLTGELADKVDQAMSVERLAVPEVADEASQPFVGQWQKLVSTTNWEKGRIIAEWRQSLVATGADAAVYSDDAWARLVGGVTPQHVGRLRRVYTRFGARRNDFGGLYWSHFHAAIDWEDAEMWLEGATRSDWSVSQMRKQRWQTLGAVEADRPNDSEIITGELDEDAPPVNSESSADTLEGRTTEFGSSEFTGGPAPEGPDFGDDDHSDSSAASGEGDTAPASLESQSLMSAAEAVRPFENLAAMPDDLADAFERLKLAILHHKTDGWRDISCVDLCAALEALKTMAVAP